MLLLLFLLLLSLLFLLVVPLLLLLFVADCVSLRARVSYARPAKLNRPSTHSFVGPLARSLTAMPCILRLPERWPPRLARAGSARRVRIFLLAGVFPDKHVSSLRSPQARPH